MKKTLFTILLALTWISCSRVETYENKRVESYNLENLNNFTVNTKNSYIEIKDTNEKEASFVVTSNTNFDINEVKKEGSLALNLEFSKNSMIKLFKGKRTYITISIPKSYTKDIVINNTNGKIIAKNLNSNIQLKTTNARVEASQIGGNATITSSNGSVNTSNINGDLKVKTSNARIESTYIRGFADLITSNGSIIAKNISGTKGFNAKTNNSRIEISNVNSSANLTTSNGSVTAFNINGDLKVKTSNSRIETNNINGYVDLKTSNGSITSKNSSSIKNLQTSNSYIYGDSSNFEKGGVIKTSHSKAELKINNLTGDNIISVYKGSLYLTCNKDQIKFGDFSSNLIKDSNKNITLEGDKIEIKNL